jgi:hypothetical protein
LENDEEIEEYTQEDIDAMYKAYYDQMARTVKTETYKGDLDSILK